MTDAQIDACFTFLSAVADYREFYSDMPLACIPLLSAELAEQLLINEFHCGPIMAWGIATTWHAARYGSRLPYMNHAAASAVIEHIVEAFVINLSSVYSNGPVVGDVSENKFTFVHFPIYNTNEAG